MRNNTRRSTRNDVLAGALAGLAGGLVMMAMRKKIVPKVVPRAARPDGFAPRQTVAWIEESVDRPHALRDEQEMALAAGGHLGYSAAMGAIYGLVRRELPFVPTPVMGAAFGLGVWALSFEGWMPRLGIKERTTSKPRRKWIVPIMGHMVYGAVTALAFERIGDPQRERSERAAALGELAGTCPERTATVGGIRMRWRECGEGFPVVLVHGLPTSPELWREVMPRIEGARVLAWELVGYGKSIPEGRGRDISVAQQAEYLEAWLSHLGVERAILVGHDLGGGVVQNVAVRRPELCAGLMLTNAAGYDNWPIRMTKVLRAASGFVEVLPDPAIMFIHKTLSVLGHEDQRIGSESMHVHWRNYRRHAAADAFVRQLRSLDVRDTLDIQHLLLRLDVPARVVWGAADQFVKVRYGERFARDLGTPLERIEGGKHFTPEDHPDEISRAVNELVRAALQRSQARVVRASSPAGS